MSENNAPVGLIIARMKRHPLVVTLTALATLIIVLSTVTDASKNLLSLFQSTARIGINGQWKAKVKYPWNSEMLSEKFHFYGEAETLLGTASFLQRPRGIVEGTIRGNSIAFKTTTQSMQGSGETSQLVHHYHGIYSDDAINLVLLTQGGGEQGEPIELNLRRISVTTMHD